MISTLIIAINLMIGINLMTIGDKYLVASAVLFVAMQLSGIFFAFVTQSKKMRPVSSILFVFYCYAFIMPGLYQTRTGEFYWISQALQPEYIEHAAFLILVSLVAMIVGYFSRVPVPRAFMRKARTPTETPAVTVVTQRTLVVTMFFSIILFVYVLVMLVYLGPLAFFATRELQTTVIAQAGLGSAGTGLTRSLSQAGALSMLATSFYLTFRLKLRSNYLRVAVAFASVSTLIAVFPLSVSRFMLVALIFVVLLTAFYGAFIKWYRIIFALMPPFLFFIFPTLGSFNRRGAERDFTLLLVSPADYMGQGEVDGFQSVVNSVHLVAVEGMSLGGQLLSVLLFFVPRSIWSGKHPPVGAEAAEVAGYEFTNISMPLPGELYANGGILLTVLGMFAFGIGLRKLDGTFIRLSGTSSPPAYAVAAVLTAAFMPILFRGSLLAVFAAYASAVAIAVLCFFLPKIRVRGRRR